MFVRPIFFCVMNSRVNHSARKKKRALRLPTQQASTKHEGSHIPPHARWRCPVSTDTLFAFPMEMQRHGFRSRTPQQPRRSESPGLLNTLPHEWDFAPYTPCQEPVRLLQELAPNFHSQVDQSSSRLHADEFRMSTLFGSPGCQQGHAIPLSGSVRGLPSPWNAYQRCVDCQLPPAEQWQSVNHHLQPAAVSSIHHWHPDLGQMRSSSRDLQLLCKCVLLRSPKRNPDGSARLHVDRHPEELSRRPHWHACTVRGSCCRSLRSERTRNKCKRIVVSLQLGVAVKGVPAPGPPCDLTRAFTWSGTLVNKASLACSSTTKAAACCHPLTEVPRCARFHHSGHVSWLVQQRNGPTTTRQLERLPTGGSCPRNVGGQCSSSPDSSGRSLGANGVPTRSALVGTWATGILSMPLLCPGSRRDCLSPSCGPCNGCGWLGTWYWQWCWCGTSGFVLCWSLWWRACCR